VQNEPHSPIHGRLQMQISMQMIRDSVWRSHDELEFYRLVTGRSRQAHHWFKEYRR
jgi:hypothetical protein